MKLKNRNGWFVMGTVGVDLGALAICDPWYLTQDPGLATRLSDAHTNGKQVARVEHHGATAVVFSSGKGDGCYAVYGRRNRRGEICEVRIDMSITPGEAIQLERTLKAQDILAGA